MISAVAVLLVTHGGPAIGSTPPSIPWREAPPLQTGETAQTVSGASDVGDEGEWPMAAANPQRTSWTSVEVRGTLRPLWYRPIEPHIPYKAQIVLANSLAYVSTSAGLYAFDVDTGNIAWVYPTEMPLGHSPTVFGGVLYVGGHDRKIHAINAVPDGSSLPIDGATGYRINDQVLWTFEAEAGFDTNPLIVDGTIYAGSRDGFFYAIDAATGRLDWRYETGGPVHFSAAYQDGVVFFASNDGHAYALDTSGNLKWKSEKLPSWGFHSWWPTIVEDTLILPAARGYRTTHDPQVGSELLGKYDVGYQLPMGAVLPDGSMRTTNAVNYLEDKPWRRSFYLLDATSGQERTYDVDDDGELEYAPLMNFGTNSGQHYPPAIGPDRTIYTSNMFSDVKYDNGISGWELEADTIAPRIDIGAGDEPIGHAVGGNVVYWTVCCDREGGAFDGATGEMWKYFDYDLRSAAPGYDSQMMGTYEANAVQVYGGWNGVYGSHGDQNPPIPYRGMVFIHRGNAVLAWSADGVASSPLPLARTVDVSESLASDKEELRRKLSGEVRKILDAGHLKPGHGAGLLSYAGKARGDNFADYFHNPGEIFYALSIASEHISPQLRNEVQGYLEREYQDFPPHDFTHVGWRDGVSRQSFDFPPEVEEDISNHVPTLWSTYDFPAWTGPDWKWNPMTFYYMWKYAQAFGNAQEVFDYLKDRMSTPPDDGVYDTYPFAHNAWIAGLHGYLELEKMAGYPESADKREELDRLLTLRAREFEKDNPWGPDSHDLGQVFAISRNFIYMTPELGRYLGNNAYARVAEAMVEYEQVAPYWFVTNFEESYNEEVMHHLYDYHALFSAKAFIFHEPAEELVKYLDVPAFQRGDLFYIQNLVATIEAPYRLAKTATPSYADQGNPISYAVSFSSRGITHTLRLTDTLPSGVGQPGEFELEGTQVTPVYDSEEHRITWNDTPATGERVSIHYTATIDTSNPEVLENTVELGEASGETSIASAIVIANPKLVYLPLVFKNASGQR